MGLGKFLKKVAHVALPIAGAYFGGPLGAAAASAVDSKALQHQGWGDTLKNAGLSAALASLAGTQGTLTPSNTLLGGLNASASGFFEPVRSGLASFGDSLLNSTGLSSGGDYLGLGGTPTSDPLATSARSLTSTAATGGATINPLTGFLPSGGTAGVGGGTPTGFFGVGDGGSDFFNLGSSVSGAPGSGVAGLVDTGTVGTNSGGLFSALTSNRGLTDSLGRAGLALALGSTNDKGYDALQNAGRQAAANYQPFLASGTAANKTLADLQGLNGPEAREAALATWRDTPGYQGSLTEGVKALDVSAARRGMLLSGNQDRAVQEYGTKLADQFYQNYLKDLQTQSAGGISAAGGVNAGLAAGADAYSENQALKANLDNNLLYAGGKLLFPGDEQTGLLSAISRRGGLSPSLRRIAA